MKNMNMKTGNNCVSLFSYFRELSIKEAMWMKQQGETTSTVERVRDMQEEIQGLKYVLTNENNY